MNNNFLYNVRKPARYIGKELNIPIKDKTKIKLKVALCYPDIYEIGMSNLGFNIIYWVLNSHPNILCERVFTPFVDMENELIKNNLSLFSLESKISLSKFDLIAFSLSHELNYTNILNMLNLAKIPLKTQNRDDSYPLVIAGGICCYNLEPIKEFFDFFIIGEGEEVILEVANLLIELKTADKHQILKEVSKIEGIFSPSINKLVNKRIIKDLNNSFYPTTQLVPYINVIHDRINLELFRGCPNDCKFCLAKKVYQPVRYRHPEVLLNIAKQLFNETGYEEISLLSLSTADYKQLPQLLYLLHSEFNKYDVAISLPSLRPDALIKIIDYLDYIKKGGLTLALEAGTERLRRIINKRIDEDELLRTIEKLSSFTSLKLYFMIGLPQEQEEDLIGIVRLVKKILKVTKNQRWITVSISPFVPKPHTAFQYESQDPLEILSEKQKFLLSRLKNRKIIIKCHNIHQSFIEAIFSRGDSKLNEVLIEAHKLGCKLDNWIEYFNFSKWLKAFEKTTLSPYHYTQKIDTKNNLPWEYIIL